MVDATTRDQRVSGLVRIGEKELTERTRQRSTPTLRPTSGSMAPTDANGTTKV